MTGLAEQGHCQPQMLVNMPAEKTEFRERSATVWLSCSSIFHALVTHTKFFWTPVPETVWLKVCFCERFEYLQWSVEAYRNVYGK